MHRVLLCELIVLQDLHAHLLADCLYLQLEQSCLPDYNRLHFTYFGELSTRGAIALGLRRFWGPVASNNLSKSTFLHHFLDKLYSSIRWTLLC